MPSAPERTPVGAPAECGSAAAPAAASAAAVPESGLPSVVPTEEVVLNLALEEVRRSGEMGGMPYRCRPTPQP